MIDELCDQIVACWNQEPTERPTALEMLSVLEAKRKEPAEFEEDFDDETITREWGDPEESTF